MTFAGIINRLIGVLQSVTFLIMTLAAVYFLYGVAKYILKYGDEGARTESIKIITRGLIALFVMFAVWGLTELILVLIGERLQVPQLGQMIYSMFIS